MQLLLGMDTIMQSMIALYTACFFFGLALCFKLPHGAYIDHQYYQGYLGTNLDTTLLYVGISIGLEAVSLAMLERFYFRPRKLTVRAGLVTIFQQRRFGLACFGECMTVACNIIYSMLKFDNQKRF